MADARVIPLQREEGGQGSGQAGDPPGEWILFACSVANLSKGGFKRLELTCAAATDRPHMLVRLEDMGRSLFEALDEMRCGGARTIRLQPIGLPFPESLLAWLPGALASWRERPVNSTVSVSIGPEVARAGDAAAKMLKRVLALHGRPLDDTVPSLGKPGWQDPPDFDFHLLVCSGPRCHVRDGASLSHMMKAECAEAGIAARCLTTTTGCMFPCNRGPMVAVYPQGDWFHLPDRAAVRRFVREVLCEGRALPEFHFHTARLARSGA